MRFTPISTPRLILRRLNPDDADAFYLLNQDPEVLRYTGDAPFADAGAARAFLKTYDQYERFGYGRWAVIRQQEGDLIGWCGLRFNPEKGETDVGFRFFRQCWGMGYATEAAKASIETGFNVFNLSRIVGRAAAANAASLRVLEKVGMTKVGPIAFSGMEGLLYEICKP